MVDGELQPIALFSKKLPKRKTVLGTYDRELTAIYKAVKYFRHLVEGTPFTVYTDHKPISFAFHRKPEPASPYQALMLDYISHFTTDIKCIKGNENIAADALSLSLSRINKIESLKDENSC